MILIYPGSFDPVTNGHVDIALRAAKFASKIIVAVLENPEKHTLFSSEERVRFLREAFAGCANIEVDSFCGLLAEYAAGKKADAIIRGIRTSEDFERENKYAASNATLCDALFGCMTETILLPASPALTFVSSTIVREAAAHIYKQGLDDSFIAKLVPPAARAALQKRLR